LDEPKPSSSSTAASAGKIGARSETFRNDPEVLVLVANDAAGEGVNLQRAHLMVNYDLPWNPNRRFGRIHRIGQTEVCHLWNLVASETREGQVYARLLEKPIWRARRSAGASSTSWASSSKSAGCASC
jgi:superfamily II DNA/RNA helicase